MMIDNLNDNRQEIRDLMRRVSQLERQSPIGFSSITRGSLRVASPEGLIVEGTARVTGILTGDGTFDWDGTIKLDGPVQIVGTVTRSGNETATGTTTLNGTTNLTGQTTITGATTVQGDLDVTGGGTIQAGAVTITPAGGGEVQVGTLTISSTGQIGDGNADGVRIGTDFRTSARVVLSSLPTVTGQTPNLWLSGSGELFRITD